MKLTLDNTHEVFLGKLDLLESHGIDEIDNGLAIFTTIINIIGSNSNEFASLCDVFSLNKEASSVVLLGDFVGVGIGNHFVTRDNVFPNFHVVL